MVAEPTVAGPLRRNAADVRQRRVAQEPASAPRPGAVPLTEPFTGRRSLADLFDGEVFLTDGKSAQVRRDGVDTRLAPTAATRLVDVNLDPPFPNAPGFRAVDLLAEPGFRAVDLLAEPGFVERFRPRVVSTTLALAWVAAGKRAAYVTDGGDLSESVHFAAGIALCRAAGCVVTGIDGAPVGRAGRGLVVAADGETHRLLMSSIRDGGRHRA